MNFNEILEEKNKLITELTEQLKYSNTVIKQLKNDMKDLLELVTVAIDKIDYRVWYWLQRNG